MGSAGVILHGEIYDADFGDPIGHEAGFHRPCLIISTDLLHNGPGRLVVVIPITRTDYGLRSHVELEPSSAGLDVVSYARCDQIRSISVDRLEVHRSAVTHSEMLEVEMALRFILDL
jgi:mRNA interferase MazF